MPRRRCASELGQAHVALVMANVSIIESWVGRLAHQDHSLPPPQAAQVDILLTAGALARRNELTGLPTFEAISTYVFIILRFVNIHGWET